MTEHPTIMRAAEIGAEHGRNAASWFFDGNTTDGAYRSILQGIEDGDPRTLDQMPTPDLAGQFADSYTERDLRRELELEDDEDEALVPLIDPAIDAYRDAYHTAATDEIAATARRMLS